MNTITGFFRLHNLTGSQGDVKTAKLINGNSIVFEPDCKDLLKDALKVSLVKQSLTSSSSRKNLGPSTEPGGGGARKNSEQSRRFSYYLSHPISVQNPTLANETFYRDSAERFSDAE